MKKNQKGFSGIEGLLTLIIIVIIAGVAWFVYHANNNTNKLLSSSASTPQAIKKGSIATTTFSDKNGAYSFQLPNNWTASYFTNTELVLKPNSFQAPGQENNWVIDIIVAPLPGSGADGTIQYANFAEYKKTTLQQTVDKQPVSQEIHINGAPVWQFDETIPDTKPLPKELNGGYRDLHYNFHKDTDKLLTVDMRVYQHVTTNYLGDKIDSAYDYSQYIPQFEAIAKSLKEN